MSMQIDRAKIFYSAKTQYENLGDLVINAELIGELRELGELVIDCGGVPQWFISQLEIQENEIFRPGLGFIGFELSLILCAFGAFFNDISVFLVLKPGHIYGSLSFAELAKTLYFAIIRMLGVRICRFGASMGPFSPPMEKLEQFRAKLMHHYAVRERLSVDYLNSLGIERVSQFPDLSWLMEPLPKGKISENQEPYIVLSFRESILLNEESRVCREQIIPLLRGIIEIVQQEFDYKVVISYQVQYDFEFSQKLEEIFSPEFNVEFMTDRLDLASAFELYSNADYVFSNRLHVLMLAMRFDTIGIPVIDATNHRKITGVFEDAQLEDIIFDIKNPPNISDFLMNLKKRRAVSIRDISQVFSAKRETGVKILESTFRESSF